jgi:hypothetical protein
MTGTMNIPERAISADGSIWVEYVDSSHRYFLRKPYARPLPSVTTILGAYDKPALVGAAANVTLDGVSTLIGAKVDLTGLSGWDIGGELYKRDLRHFQVWKGAAKRGTFAHAVNQSWIENGTVPDRESVPADYAPHIQAFGAFLRDHEPRFITSEEIVASIVHGFGGRYDATLSLTKRCAKSRCTCSKICEDKTKCLTICACHLMDLGAVIRGDWKTSKAIYFEYMAQLDLYEVAAKEMGEAEADHRCPLRLGADGNYQLLLSHLPVGGAVGLAEGYRARKRVEDLHKHLNPRRGRRG